MDDLTTLLHDAVDDVEPRDRLGAIREQTQRRSRGRWFVVGGAVLATAAVVTAVAVVVQPGGGSGTAPSDRPTASGPAGTGPDGLAVPVYYVGDTGHGPRLFREFHRVPAASVEDSAALVTLPPDDPDYRTVWDAGTIVDAEVVDGVVEVELGSADLQTGRPGLSAPEAALAVQQVVYTVTANLQQDLPVLFTSGGVPAYEVLGVETWGRPLVRADQLDVLSMVSISNPVEGRVVEGPFTADGVASSFEGTVPWRLEDAAGEVVLEGSAQGTMEDHLTPWRTDPIDVSGLPAGTYTFVASTDDPTGGTEGPGPDVDTRTVVVR